MRTFTLYLTDQDGHESHEFYTDIGWARDAFDVAVSRMDAGKLSSVRLDEHKPSGTITLDSRKLCGDA